jgi:ketol-acid reductoisomerase
VAEIFVDDDADLALVQDRNVAVLGYDDQAAAHALCLRDSGVDVRVGLAAESPRWDDAVADGLRVVTTYEACEEADLLVLPVSTTDDATVVEAVRPNLVAGDVVVLHEAAVLPGDVAAGVDVVRVAPWASGYVARDEFAQGRGVPLFASVVVDGSGRAWDIALAYARAIGATRAGVIRTTDAEYSTARSEAELTLMRGAVLPLVRAGFDSLVEAGCQPEVAYLRCIYGLRLFAEELVRGGLDAELAAARVTPKSGSDGDPLPSAAALVRSLMAWERVEEPRLH